MYRLDKAGWIFMVYPHPWSAIYRHTTQGPLVSPLLFPKCRHRPRPVIHTIAWRDKNMLMLQNLAWLLSHIMFVSHDIRWRENQFFFCGGIALLILSSALSCVFLSFFFCRVWFPFVASFQMDSRITFLCPVGTPLCEQSAQM